jgi:hypothetical protein
MFLFLLTRRFISIRVSEISPMASAEKSRHYRVQPVESALDILNGLFFQQREIAPSEVIGKTGPNETTGKRSLSNFASPGLLPQDPHTRQYLPGMRFFEQAGMDFSSLSLRRAAAYPMNRLQKTWVMIMNVPLGRNKHHKNP